MRRTRRRGTKRMMKMYKTPSNWSARFFDAFVRGAYPVPVPGVQGPFVTVPTVTRNAFSTGNTYDTILIYNWTPTERRWYIIYTGTDIPQGQTNNYMQGFGSMDMLNASAPVSTRPLAATIRLRISTVFTSINGICRVLSTPNPIRYAFENATTPLLSQAGVNDIIDQVTKSPATRTYAAAEFQQTLSFNIAPASQDAYKEYHPWFTGGTNEQTKRDAINEGFAPAPMNTMIFHFPRTLENNPVSYDCAYASQDAVRYANSQLLSQLARQPPLRGSNIFMGAVRDSQRDASAGRNV